MCVRLCFSVARIMAFALRRPLGLRGSHCWQLFRLLHAVSRLATSSKMQSIVSDAESRADCDARLVADGRSVDWPSIRLASPETSPSFLRDFVDCMDIRRHPLESCSHFHSIGGSFPMVVEAESRLSLNNITAAVPSAPLLPAYN